MLVRVLEIRLSSSSVVSLFKTSSVPIGPSPALSPSLSSSSLMSMFTITVDLNFSSAIASAPLRGCPTPTLHAQNLALAPAKSGCVYLPAVLLDGSWPLVDCNKQTIALSCSRSSLRPKSETSLQLKRTFDMENIRCYGERKRAHMLQNSWVLPDQGSSPLKSCLYSNGTPLIVMLLIYIGDPSTDGGDKAHDVLRHPAKKTIYSYIGQIHEWPSHIMTFRLLALPCSS